MNKPESNKDKESQDKLIPSKDGIVVVKLDNEKSKITKNIFKQHPTKNVYGYCLPKNSIYKKSNKKGENNEQSPKQ